MDNTASLVLGIALAIIMLGMGLGLTKEDFTRVFKYPKAMVIGLVNQLILLPLIAYLLVSSFNLPIEIAIGVMILAACPGGPTSNLLAHLAKGDTALSVSLTAVSSFITIITIPFIVNFALSSFTGEGADIQLNVVETIVQIMAITVIPVLIGMFLRNRKEALATSMAKPVRIASAVLLALIIVGIILKEKENVASYFKQAGLVTLVLNVVTMSIGFATAKLFQLNRAQGISISIETGIQNGTLAIAIAIGLLSNSAYAIAPAVYSLVMFFTGGLIAFLANRK